MKTVINKTEKTVNTRTVNAKKNADKLAQSKSINLLNEVIKDAKKKAKLGTVKNKNKNKASFKNCVIGTNNLMKQECLKLGYAIKLFIDAKDTTLTNRPISEDFTQYDKIKMIAIYEIIELARKDNKLYKYIETIQGIKTKKGKFVPYYLGTKLFNEKREIMLTKYVNSNLQEREIFTFE